MISFKYSFLRPAKLATLVLGIGTTLFCSSARSTDCCGGGTLGMPNIRQFAHSSRLRLNITPSARSQILEIWDVKSGARLSTVPVGGSSGTTPFGITANVLDAKTVGYTLRDAPVAQNNLDVRGSVSPTSSDSASVPTDEECNDGKCGWKYSYNSGYWYPADTSVPGDKCSPVGKGKPKNSTPDAPDEPSRGGGPGEPVSPEAGVPPPPEEATDSPPPLPPPGESGDGDQPPPAAPDLYDSILETFKRTRSGANLELSVGQNFPPLTFSARYVVPPLTNDHFRRYFTTALVRAFGTAIINEPKNDFDEQPIEDVREYKSATTRVIVGDDGLRSMLTDAAINLKFEEGEWVLTFTPVEPKETMEFVNGQMVWLERVARLDAEGYFKVHDVNEALNYIRAVPPTVTWKFSWAVEGAKHILNVSVDSASQRDDYRIYQENEGDTFHTSLEVGGTEGKSETIARDEFDGNGNWNYIRGAIEHRGTDGEASKSGWIAKCGPLYAQAPVADETGIATVHFGGSGNTLWRWADNGSWEKVSVSPSIDAPVRRVETLRSKDGTGTPMAATFATSHATVEEISELRTGRVLTETVFIDGAETSRTTTATNELAGHASTETRLRYPAGPQSTPLISYEERYSSRSPMMGAGRMKYRLAEDGSAETYEYQIGTYHAGTREFNAGGSNSATAYETRRTLTRADGLTNIEVDIEDSEGNIVCSRRYAVVSGSASSPGDLLEETFSIYDGRNLLQTVRKVAGQPEQEVYLREGAGPTKTVTETDESGVKTVQSNFDTQDRPLVVKRLELSASSGMPLLPEQRTTVTYDSGGRLKSRLITAGANATILSSEERGYDSAGRLRSVTVNGSLKTEYEYHSVSGGGQETKVSRRAILPDGSESSATLLSTTEVDWRGRLVSKSGIAVVSETETEVPGTNYQTVSTITRGGSVSMQRTYDNLGRTVGELVNVPGGWWQTRSYDPKGRPLQERMNGDIVREWQYPYSGTQVETVIPSPDPVRTTSHTITRFKSGNAVWESRIGGEFEVQRQLTGLPYTATTRTLSVQRTRRNNGPWTTTTISADLTDKCIVQSVLRPGVPTAMVTKTRAGVVAWDRPHLQVAATVYTHDALGRPTQIVENNVRTTTLTYDPVYGGVASATVVGTDGSSSTQSRTFYPPEHAMAGQLKSETTNSQTIYFAWTARGELRAQWGATYPVKYEYDEAGRLRKMWTYTSDPALTSPATSNPETWPGGAMTEWVYHPGTMALQQKKDASAKGATYSYDPRGGVLSRTWARTLPGGGAVTSTYAYNAAGELRSIDYSDTTPDVSLTRDSKGRITSVSDGAGGYTYGYHPTEGWLDREVKTGTGDGILYDRDAYGRRSGYGYWEQNSGTWKTWGGWAYHPFNGRMNGVSTPEGWISYSYDTLGGWPSSSLTVGAKTFVRTVNYDDLGRLQSVALTGGSEPNSRTYSYNAAGQRQSVVDEANDS